MRRNLNRQATRHRLSPVFPLFNFPFLVRLTLLPNCYTLSSIFLYIAMHTQSTDIYRPNAHLLFAQDEQNKF